MYGPEQCEQTHSLPSRTPDRKQRAGHRKNDKGGCGRDYQWQAGRKDFLEDGWFKKGSKGRDSMMGGLLQTRGTGTCEWVRKAEGENGTKRAVRAKQWAESSLAGCVTRTYQTSCDWDPLPLRKRIMTPLKKSQWAPCQICFRLLIALAWDNSRQWFHVRPHIFFYFFADKEDVSIEHLRSHLHYQVGLQHPVQISHKDFGGHWETQGYCCSSWTVWTVDCSAQKYLMMMITSRAV